LTSDRIEFIDYISKIFSVDKHSKILYDILKEILDKIVSGSNYEVKIANLIGLIMRGIIVWIIVSEAQKLGANNFSQDDMIKFASKIFIDFITNTPSDRCLFDDKLNFFEFTPNICNIKSIKQESCEKCPECKKTDIKCPECKKTDIKCPECKKTECVCPECKTKDNGSRNIIIAILVIIIIVLGILIFTKDCPNNLNNLSKLK
jgi:hypothetical protein